jgi:hypothetical protein
MSISKYGRNIKPSTKYPSNLYDTSSNSSSSNITSNYPRLIINNDDNFPFRSEPKKKKVKYLLYHHLHDNYLPPLKKFERPYFSPKHNSWEIDLMFVNYKEPSINTKYEQIYLILININTKYLIIRALDTKSENEIMKELVNILNSGIKINNIRGDSEKAFISYNIKNFLKNNHINYYFTSNQHTNRNRVVDRVIRTIRDMFDNIVGIQGNKALLDKNNLQLLVGKYNNTPHSAFDFKFTPVEVQNNPDVETVFIRDKLLKLDDRLGKQEDAGYFNYKPGDILLVYIPRWKVFEKRRRNFNCLAKFIRYVNGNVECEMIAKEDIYSVGNNKIITIPIYFTKFVSESNNFNNNIIKNYFNLL